MCGVNWHCRLDVHRIITDTMLEHRNIETINVIFGLLSFQIYCPFTAIQIVWASAQICCWIKFSHTLQCTFFAMSKEEFLSLFFLFFSLSSWDCWLCCTLYFSVVVQPSFGNSILCDSCKAAHVHLATNLFCHECALRWSNQFGKHFSAQRSSVHLCTLSS